MRAGVLALALLLAGCATGAGDWRKAGAEQSAAERDYQECRELAADAVKTQADIDQDIFATRQNDWQRASVVRQQAQIMHEHTHDRAAAILDSCMKGKGFSPKR